AGSPCGNVGHRQLFKFLHKAFPKLVSITTFGEAFFLALPSFYFFYAISYIDTIKKFLLRTKHYLLSLLYLLILINDNKY
ncbi:hypothetical protein ACOTWI_09420, partial [Aliarcobacter butzleri]